MAFPHKIVDVEQVLKNNLICDFKAQKTGFVEVGQQKWLLPKKFETCFHNYYNMKLKPDDVFIVTYPRSGTTWVQELIWLLANDLDFKTAANIPLGIRFPFIDREIFLSHDILDQLVEKNHDSSEKLALIKRLRKFDWNSLEQNKGRRFIKSHLPMELLPPNLLNENRKVIYVARNPKDVAVSYYHFCSENQMFGYCGDFSKFWSYFQNGKIPYSPYFPHILTAWEARKHKNFCFIFYEDLKTNTIETIQKVGQFLNVKYSELQYKQLKEHLSIENFRRNSSVNMEFLYDLGLFQGREKRFIGKGKIGGWQDYFSDDLNKEANEWIENSLKKSDFKFPNYY